LTDTHSILIADDNEVLLDGFTAIITRDPSLRVVATAGNGKELINKVLQLSPEVCLIDMEMPDMNGLGVSEILHKHNAVLKIIILSNHKENSLIKRIRAAGINGFLLKNCDSEELLFAIREVIKGSTYFGVG
jgi:DNA-binding NarL/FixJ family response regulator